MFLNHSKSITSFSGTTITNFPLKLSCLNTKSSLRKFNRTYVTEVLSTIGDVPTICILGLAAFGAYSLINYLISPSSEDEEDENEDHDDEDDDSDSSTDPIPNPIPDPIPNPIPDPIPNPIPDPIPNPLADPDQLYSVYVILVTLYSKIRAVFPQNEDSSVDKFMEETDAAIGRHHEKFGSFPSVYEEIYFTNVTLAFFFNLFLPLLVLFIKYRKVFLLLIRKRFLYRNKIAESVSLKNSSLFTKFTKY